MADVYLLREEERVSSTIDTDQRTDHEDEVEEGIFCRYCGHYITSVDRAMEMNGRHSHTFFNPAGIVYEIRCFSSAKGCVPHGPASQEFTWFAGYHWCIVLCSACAAHLGWSFSSGDTGFYGLIAKNISR